MSWYLEVWKNCLDFGGRARRKEYWFFILFDVIAYIALVVLEGAFRSAPLLSSLYLLAAIVPTLSVTFRRLHDTGRSAWWIFIHMIPVIGGIWFFVLLCLDSEGGANQYGPNPKM